MSDETTPHDGFDPEVRAFMSRLMAGYEGAHRRVADLCDTLATRLEAAESIAIKALEMQVRVAHEREELISARHQRDVDAELVRQRGEVVAGVARDVRALLPLAAKKLMGAPLTGNDSHGLQTLLKTMSPDQVEAVIVHGRLELSDSQRILLGTVLQSLAHAEDGQNPTETVQ